MWQGELDDEALMLLADEEMSVLDLSGARRLTSDTISDVLRGMPMLRVLDLSFCNFEPALLASLHEFVPRLEVLRLQGLWPKEAKAAAHALAQSLPKLSQPEHAAETWEDAAEASHVGFQARLLATQCICTCRCACLPLLANTSGFHQLVDSVSRGVVFCAGASQTRQVHFMGHTAERQLVAPCIGTAQPARPPLAACPHGGRPAAACVRTAAVRMLHALACRLPVGPMAGRAGSRPPLGRGSHAAHRTV